jgi:hypothetical protein
MTIKKSVVIARISGERADFLRGVSQAAGFPLRRQQERLRQPLMRRVGERGAATNPAVVEAAGFRLTHARERPEGQR